MFAKPTILAAFIGAGIMAVVWLLTSTLGSNSQIVRGKFRASYTIVFFPHNTQAFSWGR